jgi:hypothetical protein
VKGFSLLKKDTRYVILEHGLEVGTLVEIKFIKGEPRMYQIAKEISYKEFRKHWPRMYDNVEYAYYKVREL